LGFYGFVNGQISALDLALGINRVAPLDRDRAAKAPKLIPQFNNGGRTFLRVLDGFGQLLKLFDLAHSPQSPKGASSAISSRCSKSPDPLHPNRNLAIGAENHAPGDQSLLRRWHEMRRFAQSAKCRLQ
jgi:hypothetical protein